MKGTAAQSEISPETRREIVEWIVQSCLGVVGYGLLLFLVAGRLDWMWGWALIPAIAVAALYVVRTYLEDKTLMEELPGYKEYAQQTRYRLLPGVW
jgi:protein-S-isoprenylcysteine O-methyltransferase Ste14